MAWWIHDHLPYSEMQFFPINWAFNINWNEKPKREIHSYAGWMVDERWKKSGYLTRSGMPNHEGGHEAEWRELADRFAF